MDLGTLGISEEQVELMDVAETVCRDLSPVSKVRDMLADVKGHSDLDWAQLGELGWLGIAIPDSFGGVGLSVAEIVPVVEQMGRRLMAGPFLSTTLAAQALVMGGTEAQKVAVLPKLAQGAAATLALSEANGAVDLAEISATATRTTDGFALSGEKVFVLNLDVAEHIVISAKLDGDVCLFLATRAQLGAYRARREILIDETKRSYALSLDGITLPEGAQLAAEKTAATLDHIHLTANLLGAAELVGATQACLDYTLDYLRTRKQFGKTIGAYQALKHPMVDAYVGYEKARSLLYAAAHSFGRQGEGEIAVRLAKIGAVNALSFAADRAIQFHGGFGFTYDCDAQLYRRRAIFHAAQHGDARYHKAKLAARLF